MSDSEVIIRQFKKLVSISLKNESINLHAKHRRIKEHEMLIAEVFYLNKEIEEEFEFAENRINIMNFDIIVKNDLLYDVMSSWQQRYRDIIYLSLCEHWSDRKIGCKLNMSRSNVQRIKKRLQIELKNKLTGGNDEEKR